MMSLEAAKQIVSGRLHRLRQIWAPDPVEIDQEQIRGKKARIRKKPQPDSVKLLVTAKLPQAGPAD